MCLLSLVREEGLFFSPNLENLRTQVVDQLHRLALVAVSGTVCRPPSKYILGNFEQVFGLIFSPMKNTWKIKFTDLIVRKDTWDFDELKLRFT